MTEWVHDLRNALEREYADGPRVAVLATVDRAGAPHARSVICRRLTDDGEIFVVSDSRSQKNLHLQGESRVELVFWLPMQRAQFRLSGEMRVIGFPADEPLRRDVWRDLSDSSRSLFFWPTPGIAAATDDAFAEAVSADVAPPDTFQVLILAPKQVERLSLNFHPHRRRLWRSEANWAGVDINP